MISEEVEEAIKDLRYLLNSGYPRDSAVEFVSDHYQLELEKRHLLARCIFSEKEVRDHQERKVSIQGAEDRRIGIDGYNVLITIESILEGERVIKCDDGFMRDLQAIFGKYKMSDSTDRALRKLLDILEGVRASEVVLLFDKQVSKSGELAGLTRRQMDKRGLDGDARTTVGTDQKVWKFEVSASSDRVIIERSERVLDIPAEVLKRENAEFLDLTKV